MTPTIYYGKLITGVIEDIINTAKLVLHDSEYYEDYKDLIQHKELLYPIVAHIIESRLRGSRSVYPRVVAKYYNGYGYRYVTKFLVRLGLIRPVAQRTQTRGQIMRYKVTDTLDRILRKHGIYPVWMDKH